MCDQYYCKESNTIQHVWKQFHWFQTSFHIEIMQGVNLLEAGQANEKAVRFKKPFNNIYYYKIWFLVFLSFLLRDLFMNSVFQNALSVWKNSCWRMKFYIFDHYLLSCNEKMLGESCDCIKLLVKSKFGWLKQLIISD